MDKIQRSLATFEDTSLLRNHDSHENDLRLKNHTITGIKQKCCFNLLSGFHVTKNFVVDMMHDVLEGVFHFDMIALINYYIDVKIFTLDDLTTYMKLHDYGVCDSKNVPPVIRPKDLHGKSLKMSAGEMLTFMRHFGRIIGDLIPYEDSVWRVYINLREILDIITCRSIRKECKNLLDTLVAEHHLLARTILKRELKAKDHHLLHYGTALAASGPIINCSSMRPEAKHKQSKLMSTVSHCKINLCETLAVKHQLKLAYLLHSNSMFPPSLQTSKSYQQTLKSLNLVFDD